MHPQYFQIPSPYWITHVSNVTSYLKYLDPIWPKSPKPLHLPEKDTMLKKWIYFKTNQIIRKCSLKQVLIPAAGTFGQSFNALLTRNFAISLGACCPSTCDITLHYFLLAHIIITFLFTFSAKSILSIRIKKSMHLGFFTSTLIHVKGCKVIRTYIVFEWLIFFIIILYLWSE